MQQADDDGESGEAAVATGLRKYRIPTSEVYNELMVSCLTNAHKALMLHTFPEKVS
jgi:hypothetical protein